MALIKALGGGGGGGSALTVKDEGSTLSAAVTSIDFVGANVTATNTGGAVTVAVSGATTPISPSAITGIYRWFKSDTGVTMDGSNRVSVWADQSGLGGGNATQATTGNMPVYTASVVDGYPGLRFTAASSQRLDLSLTGLVGTAYTIMLVTGRRTATVPNYCFGAITSGTTNASLHLGWTTASGSASWGFRQWSNDMDLIVESYTAGRFHTMFNVLNTTLGRKIETFDGTPNGTITTTTTLGSIPGGGTIGMAVGTYWEGDIVEIAVWTVALTKAQRDGVRAYLIAKYPSAVTTW